MCVYSRQRITSVCIMGYVALPSMGVVTRKLPGPPESLVDTRSSGLVSFPHRHLAEAGGLHLLSWNSRLGREQSFLPTACCEKPGWGCRTARPVLLAEIGPSLRPSGDPVRLAPRLPTQPAWVAMMSQPFSPRQALGLWRQPWHPPLTFIHFLAFWPGDRRKEDGMVPGKVSSGLLRIQKRS